MKNLLCFSFFVLLLSAACTREPMQQKIAPAKGVALETFTSDELKLLTDKQSGVRYTEDETEKIINDAVAILETNEVATRSVGRRIGNSTPIYIDIPAGITRNANDKPAETSHIFTIVDFENEEGYALISTDRRIPDNVIIAVGHGNFPTEANNPGFEVLISRAENYAVNSILKYERWADSVKAVLSERFEEEDIAKLIESRLNSDNYSLTTRAAGPMRIVYSKWKAEEHIKPLVPVEWGQGSPFNQTVVANTPWSSTPAGCVAIATVQLMARWQHPTKFETLTLNWNELCRWSGDWDRADRYKNWDGPMSNAPVDTRTLCANLIWRIGVNVDMDYGQYGSYAVCTKAINLLSRYGFTVSSKQNYSRNPVVSSLAGQRPVFISGFSYKTTSGSSITYDGGHAWLIDGFLKQVQTETIWDGTTIVSVTYHYREFFHNNFGWYGADNGYYTTGLFDPINDPDLPSNTRITEGGINNYRYNLEIWPNIYK